MLPKFNSLDDITWPTISFFTLTNVCQKVDLEAEPVIAFNDRFGVVCLKVVLMVNQTITNRKSLFESPQTR